jgi:hypothetical protein
VGSFLYCNFTILILLKDWNVSKRLVKRNMPKLDLLQKEENEGTMGGSTLVFKLSKINNFISSLLSIASSEIDKQLPSLATMQQLFGGVVYERLPIAFVIAKYTNTKIIITDHQVNLENFFRKYMTKIIKYCLKSHYF